MQRRKFMQGMAGIAATLPQFTSAAVTDSSGSSSDEFTFVHCTDSHVQPLLNAPEGTARCFEHISSLKPDFAIAGGDQVSITDNLPTSECRQLYHLYADVERSLACKVFRVVGNHDVVGFGHHSPVLRNDPLFGKALYEEEMGKRYYSFDYKKWHFIVLDSINILPFRSYSGLIDQEQLDWLTNDLRGVDAARPVAITTHIPLATAWSALHPFPPGTTPGLSDMPGQIVDNNLAVRKLFQAHNLKLVMQGHTHVWETVAFNGVQYITGGAVCGNWWRGIRSGTRNGYAVYRVKGDTFSVEYVTYPWNAPQGLEPDERPLS